MDVSGLVPCEGGRLGRPIDKLDLLPIASPVTHTLAACHSLSKVGNKLSGNNLEIKIFDAIGWDLVEDPHELAESVVPIQALVRPSLRASKEANSVVEISILKTFPFESKAQRMSTIARKHGEDHLSIYVKGAPEKLRALCSPATVPENFDRVLEWYTTRGLRVLALASRSLNLSWEMIDECPRDEMESDLHFHGFLLLQNLLKPETPAILRMLHRAQIPSVMITGDNLRTAISVAQNSELVSRGDLVIIVRAEQVAASSRAAMHLKVHFYDSSRYVELKSEIAMKCVHNDDYFFATEGESFELLMKYDEILFRKILHRGRIFARMKPEQKVLAIEHLQALGHQVGMCGDGCNDCGALKAAHMGISLSPAEASVAAPFTSKQQDISCVPTLIREGRATLVSTYACFKYNISYCFAALLVVVMQFSIYTEPSDAQYLIMDLIIICVPSLVIGNTGAGPTLGPMKPTKRILHLLHISSIVSFLVFNGLFYSFTWFYTKAQPWFEAYVYIPGMFPSNPSYENTAMMSVVNYSFIVSAVIFSHSRPFRKRIYTNRILFGYLILAVLLCMLMQFYSGPLWVDLLNFRPPPQKAFQVVLLLAALVMALVCFVWETWFLYGLIEGKMMPWIRKLRGPKLPFELIEQELGSSPDWPPLEEGPGRHLSQEAPGYEGRRMREATNPSDQDGASNVEKEEFEYTSEAPLMASSELEFPSSKVVTEAEARGGIFKFNYSVNRQRKQATGSTMRTFGVTKQEVQKVFPATASEAIPMADFE